MQEGEPTADQVLQETPVVAETEILTPDYRQFVDSLNSFRDGLPDVLKPQILVVDDKVNKSDRDKRGDFYGRRVMHYLAPGVYVKVRPEEGQEPNLDRFVFTSEDGHIQAGFARPIKHEEGRKGAWYSTQFTFDKGRNRLATEEQVELKAKRDDALKGIKETAKQLEEVVPFDLPDLS
jgi:hypothetical protein